MFSVCVVEANAKRAKLVRNAQDWDYGREHKHRKLLQNMAYYLRSIKEEDQEKMRKSSLISFQTHSSNSFLDIIFKRVQ